ncbi:MAG: hypothetical protein ACI865_003207, partial [Flavobacteriaceae bacterium]
YPLEGVAFDIIDSKGSIVLMGKLTDAALIATTQLVKGEYMLRIGGQYDVMINFVKL